MDAGERGWQRSVRDRGKEGEDSMGLTKRKIPQCHANNYTTTTALHSQTHKRIHNQMHKVSGNSQLSKTK